jgi:phage tail-like protein
MATRHLLDYLPAILLEESSKNPLIEGFLQIIETFLIGDTAKKIHDIYDPHPATLVRAQVEVSSVGQGELKLTLGTPGDKPNPLRAGDTIQVTDVANQFSRIHYTTIEKQSNELKHVLILQNKFLIADGQSIRLADVTESTRCFRVAPGHQISRGNRIVLSQNIDAESVEASGTVVDVDGDFIYLARGLSKTFTLDDKASPVSVRRVYEPIEKTIDDLVNLFDPWKTRPDLLPWLASVVGLDISPQWNEYQKRLLLSQIAGLHHRLGTKEAMLKLIDIYVPESRKGRICIDDCESLYRLKITNDNHGQLDLLAQSIHYSSEDNQPTVSLLHPTAIVADGTGHYYVADIGGADSDTSTIHPAAIWKITESGAIVGKPITGDPIKRPIGLATDKSKNLLVLNAERNGNFSVIEVAGIEAKSVFELTNFLPCGLCYRFVDASTELIFIAGKYKDNGQAKVISLKKTPTKTYILEHIYDLSQGDATNIEQPISFLQISESAFLIGDGKNEKNSAANIFYVELDLSVDEIKKGPISLLLNDEKITYPQCIIRTGVANHFILIDTGLRNPQAGQGFGQVITTPTIYLIITDSPESPTKATLEKISTNKTLSNPFAVRKTQSNEYILIDKGFFNIINGDKEEFRSLVHKVSIVNHFKETSNMILPVRKSIKRIGTNSKPSHVEVFINFAES